MSVIFGMQRKDLIGATLIDVDGRDAEGDMFDLQHITLKLVNNEHVRVSVDRFEDTYLDIETVKYVGDDTSESQRFDHFRKPIDEMSYGELRKMETMTLTQPRTREERHACLDARNYLREKPPKFEKQRLAEARWRNAYKPKSAL